MDITRPLFWNINGKSIMYIVAFAAFLIFFLGVSNKIRGWRKGRKDSSRPVNLAAAFKSLFLHDSNIFKSKLRRRMHSGIFYGFLILLIGTIIVGLQEHLNIYLFHGPFYLILSLLLDLLGLLAMIGIGLAAYKRYYDNRDGKNTIDDAISLTLIFIILLTGFILEGLRIFAAGDPWAGWTPVGLLIAVIAQLTGLSAASARSVHAVLWYCHMLLSMGFIAYIPYSKLFHVIASPLNILLKPSSSVSALTPVGMDSGQNGSLGVARLEDFTRKQLIELDACISCLRCEKQCPSYQNDMSLSPRELVQVLKKHAAQRYSFFGRRVKSFDSDLFKAGISREALLSCTTCGKCEEKCPMSLEHVRRVVEIRRSFMSGDYGVPDEARKLYENLINKGNPWGESPDKINDWGVPFISEKKSADILYWAGCFGTYDSRNQQVARTMFKLFEKAGADFAVMGPEAKCCGDTARRLGNEPLFQELAAGNIKALNGYEFNTIVTACPHCYNTLKNEYPELGGVYRVLHHSEYIAGLIESGKIKPEAGEKRKVTYHDPCYLGRFNNVYSAPRRILTSIPGLELAEMRNRKEKSKCCGAGGGQIWLNNREYVEKISQVRAREAVKTEADIIVSACPLCLVTLGDAAVRLKPNIKNMDIAELISCD